MNYREEQLRNALAAEYVLGTLRGPARQRYQLLMMQSQTIRETTWVWEQHLNGLGGKLPPVAPDPRVWQQIQQRLGLVSSDNTNVVAISTAAKRVWQGATFLATAAALVLAVLFARVEVPVPVPTQEVAVFQDTEAQTLWIIDITPDTIEVQATTSLRKRPNNDYQLWMVAKDGSPPIPLGLMPQAGKVSLAKHPQFEQLDLAALAVSLEPVGGSPTGTPTEVLYIAELVTT